jgi:Terminase small subunit
MELRCVSVAVLNNPRHERFAQLVATGKGAKEAYVDAGYAGRAAYTCGPRLLKDRSVRTRVQELQHTMATVSTSRAAVDREFVLRELVDNALAAKRNGQYSASNKAFELLGKELGMFQENRLEWDGDPTKLSDQQLEQMVYVLERKAYGDDQTKILASRRRMGAIDIEWDTPRPFLPQIPAPSK